MISICEKSPFNIRFHEKKNFLGWGSNPRKWTKIRWKHMKIWRLEFCQATSKGQPALILCYFMVWSRSSKFDVWEIRWISHNRVNHRIFMKEKYEPSFHIKMVSVATIIKEILIVSHHFRIGIISGSDHRIEKSVYYSLQGPPW